MNAVASVRDRSERRTSYRTEATEITEEVWIFADFGNGVDAVGQERGNSDSAGAELNRNRLIAVTFADRDACINLVDRLVDQPHGVDPVAAFVVRGLAELTVRDV